MGIAALKAAQKLAEITKRQDLRTQFKTIVAQAEKEAVREAMVDDVPDAGIFMTSGCNMEGKPFVHYTWDGKLRKTQWSPDEAREHALGLIQCANAAEFDASCVSLLIQKLGLSPEAAAMFTQDLRNFRRPKG